MREIVWSFLITRVRILGGHGLRSYLSLLSEIRVSVVQTSDYFEISRVTLIVEVAGKKKKKRCYYLKTDPAKEEGAIPRVLEHRKCSSLGHTSLACLNVQSPEFYDSDQKFWLQNWTLTLLFTDLCVEAFFTTCK